MNSFYATYLPDKPDVVEQIKALDHLATEGKMTFDEHMVETLGARSNK